MRAIRRFDFYVIGLVLVSALALIMVQHVFTEDEGRIATIYEGGKILTKVDLTKEQVTTFNFGEGRQGSVEVKAGRIRMLAMEREICPNAVCSKTGWIAKPRQTIVCLPNKLVVEIQGGKQDYDGITA